jgi:hypothetical protein
MEVFVCVCLSFILFFLAMAKNLNVDLSLCLLSSCSNSQKSLAHQPNLTTGAVPSYFSLSSSYLQLPRYCSS